MFFLYDGPNLVQEQSWPAGASGATPTGNLLTGLGIDETFTRTDATGTSTLLTDALDGIVELADAAGTLQTHYTFEPFGATTTLGATNSNTQQFTARENDGTGLYYYRARYYNPKIGRFISEDPIGFKAGPNLYSYASNQPTNRIDPTGTWDSPWHALITNWAMLAQGADAASAAAMAAQVAAVDFRKGSFAADPADANTHAMSGRKNGRPQSCDDAFESTNQQLAEDLRTGDIAKLLHTIQDATAPGHRGFQPWGGGTWPGWTHFWGDAPIFKPFSLDLAEAAAATSNFIRDYRNGSVRDLSQYLPPKPCQ